MQKNVRFIIAEKNIPMYKDDLTDRHKGIEIYHQAQEGPSARRFEMNR